jgi:hypothetical protein
MLQRLKEKLDYCQPLSSQSSFEHQDRSVRGDSRKAGGKEESFRKSGINFILVKYYYVRIFPGFARYSF